MNNYKLFLISLIFLIVHSTTDCLVCYVCDSSIQSNCLNGPFDGLNSSKPSLNAICMATYSYNGEAISKVIRGFSNTCQSYSNTSTRVYCCSFDHCNTFNNLRILATSNANSIPSSISMCFTILFLKMVLFLL
ncbi:unnamed protein product [Brachionus calyciflorus]|uniref:Uncharacterized protein n=1 Tax=Brachionus calyciflorus TaxID=104777 RepID=A0A813QV19_9BILA|nr:unnamed protein product [Brachionus calyciflorus]